MFRRRPNSNIGCCMHFAVCENGVFCRPPFRYHFAGWLARLLLWLNACVSVCMWMIKQPSERSHPIEANNRGKWSELTSGDRFVIFILSYIPYSRCDKIFLLEYLGHLVSLIFKTLSIFICRAKPTAYLVVFSMFCVPLPYLESYRLSVPLFYNFTQFYVMWKFLKVPQGSSNFFWVPLSSLGLLWVLYGS